MAKINYRALKKRLNKYHKFSFPTPRKGKDFTPQQKAAISRLHNKIYPALKSVNKETNGWLPIKRADLKKLGPNFDYRVKTNKGVFTKFPNPVLYKNKSGKKLYVGTTFLRRKEIYFPFPEGVVLMWQIEEYVDGLVATHKPDYIRWSVNGYRGSALYDPDTFSLYASQFDETEDEDFYFNGVFLGFNPEDLK